MLFYWFISSDLLKIMPLNKCHVILVMKSQHWFRDCLVRQQGITWANIDPEACRHMASPGHNVWTQSRSRHFHSRIWSLNDSHIRSLQWRHNGPNGVSNHQHHDCLLNRLFKRRSKKTSKLRATGLCAGNSPVTGDFPAKMASNAENVSIWLRHHDLAYWGYSDALCCHGPGQHCFER